jgi:opacity protein-like surface antigen
METKIICLAGLMSVSSGYVCFSCRAQGLENSTLLARYYTEAHLSRSDYEIRYPGTPNLGGVSPWQVVVGRQLSPRWAVQLGYAFKHDSYGSDHMGTTLTGQRTYGWRTFNTWTHAVPLAVRYDLYRLPNSRLHIDALLGITFVRARFKIAAADYVDDVLVEEGRNQDRASQWYVTAGVGVRYPFSRRFEGVFNYGYARNFKRATEHVHAQTTGNSWGLTRSFSIGLRYRFAIGKPRQAE